MTTTAIVPHQSKAVWPYSTHDDVSHLVMSDVPLLRARIDQLLEERRDWRRASGLSMDVHLPRAWKLTPGENRVLADLVKMAPGAIASKERLHSAFSGEMEAETEIKIVDVIICKVRKKLKDAGFEPSVIETVWGRGYTLCPVFRAAVLKP